MVRSNDEAGERACVKTLGNLWKEGLLQRYKG